MTKHTDMCLCAICYPMQYELVANRFIDDGVEYIATGVWIGITNWRVDYTMNGIHCCMSLMMWNARVRRNKNIMSS